MGGGGLIYPIWGGGALTELDQDRNSTFFHTLDSLVLLQYLPNLGSYCSCNSFKNEVCTALRQIAPFK